MSSTGLRVKELLREKQWTTKVLAEKTGMSESYLTHLKNGTRRWNEDALRKLANAFELDPVQLLVQHRTRTDCVESAVSLPDSAKVDVKVQAVPMMTEIPANPSPYNNQLAQVTSGCKDMFFPILSTNDPAIFALMLNHNHLAPTFAKSDILVISPDMWTRSGDIAAVEYGNETLVRAIMKVTYTDDFTVLEAVNFKQSPIALIRGKDHFRVIGRVVARYQNFLE